VVIRGPNVTRGYEDNPEANRAAFVEDWFRTGDQGVIDADGYLTLTGRLKEIINRGGEKIAPREIDEALLAHPGVAQAVTFAVPHTSLGEAVAAAVVPRPGCRPTEAELRGFAAGRLASFKVPEKVVLLDEIPKGPTGKLRRVGLAEVLGLTADDLVPPSGGGESEGTSAPPDLEALVARVWAEVLRIDEVDPARGFLEHGGDSVLAAQIVARLRTGLGVDLPLVTLFARPTVAGMAEVVSRSMARSDRAGGGELSRLLDELEGLSAEEAKRLIDQESRRTE
jgi:aryl carrier-like protein